MTNSLAILHRLISFDTVSHRSNLSLINYVEDYLRARNFRLHKSVQNAGVLYGVRLLLHLHLPKKTANRHLGPAYPVSCPPGLHSANA